jgi:membrane dipeptidase
MLMARSVQAFGLTASRLAEQRQSMTVPETSLHQAAFVMDGLVYHSDGDTAALNAGGINAINLTVAHFEADFTTACKQMAGWHARVSAPDSPWMIIERAADFDVAQAAGKVGIVMGWQNGRALDEDVGRLAFFHRTGLRIMQLTYNYRNMLGDGCMEPEDGGLSAIGHEAVDALNRHRIAIDLSHVGERTGMMTVERSTLPCLLTHANAHAVTPLARNKSDALIQAVAAKGGMIGASTYGPMCWAGDPARKPVLDDFIRHLDYLVDLVGIEHVGFGTDLAAGADNARMAYDRETPRRWDVIENYMAIFGRDIPARYIDGFGSHAEMPRITDALPARGWSDDDVRAYLGGNFKRVLGEIWGG